MMQRDHGRRIRIIAGAGEIELAANRRAVVVIADENEQRNGERREELPNRRVLRVGSTVGQVARDQDGAGRRPDRSYRLDGRSQPGDWIALDPFGADMGVAELHE